MYLYHRYMVGLKPYYSVFMASIYEKSDKQNIINSSKISKMKYLPKSIFEPEEKIATIPQMAYFYDDYIALRRERDSNSRSGFTQTTV